MVTASLQDHQIFMVMQCLSKLIVKTEIGGLVIMSPTTNWFASVCLSVCHKPCLHSSSNSFHPIFTKLGQNLYLDESGWNMAHFGSKTRSLGHLLFHIVWTLIHSATVHNFVFPSKIFSYFCHQNDIYNVYRIKWDNSGAKIFI